MRSSIHGTFATLLLLIPVGAIPALAIFGIPQFAPVVASPLHEGHVGDRERRVGDSARAPADDLFHDDTDFPSRGEDATSAPGRLGDSVPVPNRNAKRGSSHDQVAELPGRLPSWAEDSAVDDRRPSGPQRSPSDFDRMASQNDVSPRNDSGSRRVAPSSGRYEESAPRRTLANEREGGAIRFIGNETVDSQSSQSYQRPREMPSDRVAPSPREETGRDSLNWQGALRRLNELEIRSFRLEPSRQANQFVFICSYTPSDSPRVSYRFEAESEEPLRAVEKVLAQIDEWQQQR